MDLNNTNITDNNCLTETKLAVHVTVTVHNIITIINTVINNAHVGDNSTSISLLHTGVTQISK